MNNSLYDNIENSLKGYKYVVQFSVSVDDPLDTKNSQLLFMCDTRDKCREEIKRHLDEQEKLYNLSGITHLPYNITRLDCYVKWIHKDEDGNEKSWYWTYGIYPVKYITDNKK